MRERTTVITEYRCPGQFRPISRAVHLGRMAAFYPGCRTCAHRDDTGTLSPRQIKRLGELRARVPRDPWSEDGVAADSVNHLLPAMAHRIGAAFGTWLAEQCLFGIQHSALSIQHSSAVLAGDGRAITARAVAALSEGLRWADVAVLDVGSATAACTAFAVRQFQAFGGVLIGNPQGTPHGVGVKFWGSGGLPLSTAEQIRPVKELYEKGVDRPTRCSAACRRVSAASGYHAQFAGWCHGLRPLRFVAASTSAPWLDDVRQLLQTTACEILPCRGFGDCPNFRGHHPGTIDRWSAGIGENGTVPLSRQIRAEHAHFGIHVFDDGEHCRVFDEQGAELSRERLRQLLPPPALADGDSDALATLLLLMQRLSRDDKPLSELSS